MMASHNQLAHTPRTHTYLFEMNDMNCIFLQMDTLFFLLLPPGTPADSSASLKKGAKIVLIHHTTAGTEQMKRMMNPSHGYLQNYGPYSSLAAWQQFLHARPASFSHFSFQLSFLLPSSPSLRAAVPASSSLPTLLETLLHFFWHSLMSNPLNEPPQSPGHHPPTGPPLQQHTQAGDLPPCQTRTSSP